MLTRSLAVTLAAGLALAPAHALPLAEVTLYRSGVGAFTHAGTVEGDAVFELAFAAGDLSDVLKTIVVLDDDPAGAPALAYAPAENVSDILGEFTIDPRQPMLSLLERLRGEDVRVATPEGEIAGMITGVETIPSPTNGVNSQHLTLLTDAGFRTIDRESVRSIDFADADLAAEVRDAYRALASRRDESESRLTLTLPGRGAREAFCSYVHAAPVWKTSYRLVLPGESGEPLLQAWAIVENQTDQDWQDVTLTVAAGKPVSFTMDLQTPFTPARPSVRPPYAAAVAPEVFERELRMTQRQALASASARANEEADFARRRETSAGLAPSRDAVNYDDAMGGQASASGLEAGAQFLFTFVDPVSIEQGRSAMLPLATEPVGARRVTVYTPQTPTPMRGVELTNTTGLDLMPGPIAVYDANTYAGDAQIAHVSKGEDRLLTYAADQDLLVVQEPKNSSRTLSMTIVDGVLTQRLMNRQSTEYKLVNRDQDDPRDVLIEHPKMPGWDLAKDSAKPATETESALRFEAELRADDAVSLTVAHERESYSRHEILSYREDVLLRFVRSGAASQEVLDAFREAAALNQKARDLRERIAELDGRTNEIAEDQRRIRDNMSRLDRGSDLRARYIQKLDEQEDELESILDGRDGLRADLEAAERTLRDYLSGLDVS